MKIINFQDAENRRFSCMKKGQQEIMGLVIVIILIVLAILVIAKLSPNQKFSYKEEYEKSMLASSMLNALLTTTSTCNELSFSQILQDCADDALIKCNEESSCAYFEQQAREIFRSTLEQWKVYYEFRAFYDKEKPILPLGNACAGNKKSELFPLPAETGILFVKLDICG